MYNTITKDYLDNNKLPLPVQVDKGFACPGFLDQAKKPPSQQRRTHHCRKQEE